MEEQALKTSKWQRIAIIIIAILLLLSTVLVYIFMVLGGGATGGSVSEEEINQLTAQYDAKAAEVAEAAQPLSDKHFNTFKGYLSQTKAYNAAAANAEGLGITDLKTGTGKTLGDDDKNYFAYYLGWCPDGSVFDSSFDDAENPTKLNAPIDPSIGLIEGWNQGVVGMKLGGVRQLTISGDLAYGDSQEICGTTGSPLKFIILAIEKDENLAKLNAELDDLYLQLYYAYYGSQL